MLYGNSCVQAHRAFFSGCCSQNINHFLLWCQEVYCTKLITSYFKKGTKNPLQNETKLSVPVFHLHCHQLPLKDHGSEMGMLLKCIQQTLCVCVSIPSALCCASSHWKRPSIITCTQHDLHSLPGS